MNFTNLLSTANLQIISENTTFILEKDALDLSAMQIKESTRKCNCFCKVT